MQLEIMRLHRELRMSIIYVTHDQEEALVMSDRIAVFNAGRIEQIGPSKELYERPVTRFVADFLGGSNFFPGKIKQLQGELCTLDGATGIMRAFNTTALAAGSSALVAIRPECLRIAEGDAGEQAENLVEGKVKDVIYLGQLRKYVVRLRGGQDVTFLQQAHDADRSNLSTGKEIRLTWHALEANVLVDNAAVST
jgi:putative spermidine/putrescine transport system ATP-binding protein